MKGLPFVDAVAEVTGEAAVARARRLIEEADERREHPPEHPVVALIGGTGSGKSSLLNALAGASVSDVGTARPTTEEPIAWLPDTDLPWVDRLLDRFGVLDRVRDPAAPDLVVIDLPDTDSIREGHALAARWVLPRADVVVWVADPVKYHDARTAEMVARHRGPGLPGVVVVLNKSDLLRPDERTSVLDDLGSFARSLGWEGQVLPVAADPASGVPSGIDAVAGAVRASIGDYDPAQALEELALDAARESIPAGIEDVPTWEEVRSELVDRVVGGFAPEQVPPSLLQAARAEGSVRGGGPFGWALHALRHGSARDMASVARERHRRLVSAWEGSAGVAPTMAVAEQRFAAVAPFTPEGEWDRSAVGMGVRSIARDVVTSSVSELAIEPERWWWAGRVVAWAMAAVVVSAVVGALLIPDLVGVLVVVALVGGAVGVGVGGAAVASGSSAARRTWEGFREAVAAESAHAADAHLGSRYRAAAGPALHVAGMAGTLPGDDARRPML